MRIRYVGLGLAVVVLTVQSAVAQRPPEIRVVPQTPSISSGTSGLSQPQTVAPMQTYDLTTPKIQEEQRAVPAPQKPQAKQR